MAVKTNKATKPTSGRHAQAFVFEFPAIKGTQAGRDYFATMCPVSHVERLLSFEDADLVPEFRAQRTINKTRVPEMARYVVDNPKSYVFSALTASIDGDITFEEHGDPHSGANFGILRVPMGSRFLINDGQHRRAALAEAVKERPELADETVAVVFFQDAGLKRSQQMFADLNTHAVRPTRSLGVLYDHRDPLAMLARQLASDVRVFKGMTEFEKTTISNRGIKLFTLSSIFQATAKLLGKSTKTTKVRPAVTAEERELALAFWNEVANNIPDWQAAVRREVSSSELRANTIHAHGIGLQALALMGADLIAQHSNGWAAKLRGIRQVDWTRQNADLWEGRATVGGKVSKGHNNVKLTANVLRQAVGLTLSPEDREIEARHGKGQAPAKSKRRGRR